MSYDLIKDAAILVEKYRSEPSCHAHKILKSEFSKWNHPIRMKFLIGAGVERCAHDFLDDLLDLAREKNALMVGPLVFEQVQYMAHHVQFKNHAFDLAAKSLTLRPPKQLHQRCHAFGNKGLWRWAGLLIPHIKDDNVVFDVYDNLIGRMTECLDDMLLQDRFETLSNDLYYMITHDPKGMERWAAISQVATYFAIPQSIDAKLSKQWLEESLEQIDRPSSVRKM